MKNSEIIKKLTGKSISEESMKNADCYARPHFAVFIPVLYEALPSAEHCYPAYTIKIYFEQLTGRQTHYQAEIISPDTSYLSGNGSHFYCIMIDREYFEQVYLMYADNIGIYNKFRFEMCRHGLKTASTIFCRYSE